jgi:predicted DNA-binding transcriptional regulator AlpA
MSSTQAESSATKLPPPPVERLTYRLGDLADTIGVSRRVIERERSAGRFPKPDLTIGRMPLWRVQTITAWIERGGRS